MVADWTGSLLEREAELAGLRAIVGAALPRRELRESAGAFADGLLSGVERKTWLADGRAGRPRSTLSHAVAPGTQFLVGGRCA